MEERMSVISTKSIMLRDLELANVPDLCIGTLDRGLFPIERQLIRARGVGFGKKSHTLDMRRLGEEVSRLDEIESIVALLAEDL